MKNYTYQNNLISKKQLRQILAWSFATYDSMQAGSLADELKYLGFQYASQAGISISVEDLKIPFVKDFIIERANQEITDSEKIYLKGKITNVERFQKIIDTWSLTSDSLKTHIVHYFKSYDPLNSVYIMASSGARGSLAQVRQLVGMRGLMSDPSGEIMNLAIKKNFKEGLSITDYLMSGYGARKGIVDTALKTANSGYLTRRLVDVSQDIIIREKDCFTSHSILFSKSKNLNLNSFIGCILNKPILDYQTQSTLAKAGTQITSELIESLSEKTIDKFYLRSPFTCKLYRAICQKCYGWDLTSESLIDLGEAIGILAGQSIGEPGTQLTMRTFHTGGIFKARQRETILSPIAGIIKFSKSLKTSPLRTNRGEDVVVTKNSGSIILIPDNEKFELIQINLRPNTILFPQHNQYVLKNTVVGEIIDTNRQLKREVKRILSVTSGEVFIPRLKRRVNVINENRLIWILFGQLFHSPASAFLNIPIDYKINPHSYISRSKVLNYYTGNVHSLNKNRNLSECSVTLVTLKYNFIDSYAKKLFSGPDFGAYILYLPTSKYLIPTKIRNQLKYSLDGRCGQFITNKFKTLVGGTMFYDIQNIIVEGLPTHTLDYFLYGLKKSKYINPVRPNTICWLPEETHDVDCSKNSLFVDQDDFISSGFELTSGLISKTSGLVNVKQKSGSIKSILIKSGLIYEGKAFKNIKKQVYYPGEIIVSNIRIKNLSICESVTDKNVGQFLVRPLYLYEVSRSQNLDLLTQNRKNSLILKSEKLYAYSSGQKIETNKNLTLILDFLLLTNTNLKEKNSTIELIGDSVTKTLKLQMTERVNFKNSAAPYLKYKSLQSCLLVQKSQFLNKYMVIGYVETLTAVSLEIVQFKVKQLEIKQILVISNTDCVTVDKTKLPNKSLNDLIIAKKHIDHIGRIILENDTKFTIQKGQPYFFPNCRTSDFDARSIVKYQILAKKCLKSHSNISHKVSINYFDITKIASQTILIKDLTPGLKTSPKIQFSKFFLKKNNRLFSCLRPYFLKKFDVKIKPFPFEEFIIDRPTRQESERQDRLEYEEQNLKWEEYAPYTLDDPELAEFYKSKKLRKISKTILIKNSVNRPRNVSTSQQYWSLLNFSEYPFKHSRKAFGIQAITEDYFEQEVNGVFCENNEFLEEGIAIGFVNLEKEITSDIVQGLPKIEGILEARKQNLGLKNIPRSRKKGLLSQSSSLNSNFDFMKAGVPIFENNRINPHKLLKIYFNYYGAPKQFLCARDKKIKHARLTDNYNGSYKSFKKVQLFILNSVQAVYRSQGVDINNKHLEVIIKQMTTRVVITSQGKGPFLFQEIIDLYHIKRMNKILEAERKEVSCYAPVLFGITRAALSNPSVMSAASFQETTRVLTKAATEGRLDWLRGLKENIIIGHLIPSGTGFQNHRNRFRQKKINSGQRLDDYISI
jgi:DNA-directed RNA polymerase subunit beta'